MDSNHLNQTLISIYKELHQNPELSYEEYQTTKRLRELLVKADIEILDFPLKTGLVACIRGKSDSPVVALRCDIDALPIEEETDATYESKNSGKMHACGHDFNMASILGATLLLKEKQKELNGTIKILFQPAEESSNGAEKVLETNVLSDVKAIFGIHANPDLKVGEIGIVEGAPTAAVDRFEIEVTGVGSHAAHPEEGVDPIVVTAQIVTAFQTIISRNIDPFDTAVISITSLHSGSTWNVIPTSANMVGTVRTLNAKTREYIPNRMKSMAEQIAAAFGAIIKFSWFSGPSATNNRKEWVEFSKDVAKTNDLKVNPYKPTLIGEDFAYYQEKIAGTFIWVGTDASYPLHNPKFLVNTDAIFSSSKYFASLAENALIKLTK